jgi:hypothetical protein
VFKKRFRASFADEIANIAPGDFEDEISKGDYKTPLRALVQEESSNAFKEYSKTHNAHLNSELLNMGYQIFYDLTGKPCVVKYPAGIQNTLTTTPNEERACNVNAAVTPSTDTEKSGKMPGAIAGSATSTKASAGLGAEEIVETTVDAASDVPVGTGKSGKMPGAIAGSATSTRASAGLGNKEIEETTVDAASDVPVGTIGTVVANGTRKSTRIITTHAPSKKKSTPPKEKKRSSTSSMKQQQPAKRFKGFCNCSKPNPCDDNQNNNDGVLEKIWSGYAEQIQNYYSNIAKEDRETRGFVLQQVAGHINKRARHQHTDALREGLIDFLNKYIDPKFNEEEEEHLLRVGYDNDDEYKISAPGK